MSNRIYGSLVVAAVVALGVAGCESSGSDGGAAKTAGPGAAADTTKPAGETAAAAEGTKHDPPIKASEVAEGQWYCDMGTVHYSRADKGDGKCPSCGMALKQKAGAGDDHAHGDSHPH